MKNPTRMAIAALTLSALLQGCGNMSLLDTHWTFDEAIIKSPDGSTISVKVKSWHDFENSDMVQVETPDRVYCTHSCNVILIKNK